MRRLHLHVHVYDAFEEGKHPRGQPGNAGQFGSSSGTKTRASSYKDRPPLSFRKDHPGTSRYLVHNGVIRPYESGSLLDRVGSLLEYKIDVKHTGTTRTTGRVEDHGDGHFVFVSDVDKMQSVPYKMDSVPTPESVERQEGFDFAVKKGKKGGDFKHLSGKSDDFSDGYREGLRALSEEPNAKVVEYQSLLRH